MVEIFESLINYGRNVSKTGNYGFGSDCDAPGSCRGGKVKARENGKSVKA